MINFDKVMSRLWLYTPIDLLGKQHIIHMAAQLTLADEAWVHIAKLNMERKAGI